MCAALDGAGSVYVAFFDRRRADKGAKGFAPTHWVAFVVLQVSVALWPLVMEVALVKHLPDIHHAGAARERNAFGLGPSSASRQLDWNPRTQEG